MYEKGDGVAQSDKIALDLYKMAQSYDSSNVVLADKINLLERRLRENAGVKKPVGVDAEIHRAPVSEVDNNAMYRNHLHQIVVGLNINAEFSAELNRGTASTPGEHLRFSAYPEAYNELAALKSALDEAGISYEERVKGVGGVEKILVIREVPRIRPGFETKLRQNYAAALDKITAEASAKHARTDGEVDRKQELDTLRDNLKALSVSSMGADPYQGKNWH